MKEISFIKMAGAGNDFLLIDARAGGIKRQRLNWPKLAVAFCDRRAGIGADGLLAIGPSRTAEAAMRIFNADGSEAAMCGNGIRCVAHYLAHGHRASGATTLRIETRAGTLSARVRGRRVAIEMPIPKHIQLSVSVLVGGRRLEMGSIDTGVPHVVVPVASLDRVEVETLGRQLRRHAMFQPYGTNVNFIELDRQHPGRLRLRTYERGVEGETLACGTGATAAAILATLQRFGRGRSSVPQNVRIEVETKSRAVLTISFCVAARPASADGPWSVTDVVMEGPIHVICRGMAPWPPGGEA